MAERVRSYLTERSHRRLVGKNTSDDRIRSHELRRPAERSIDPEAVPLFLSNDYAEQAAGEYVAPMLSRRRISISARILAGVCTAAAAAVLFAMFSSDAMRDIVKVKASMAGVAPVAPAPSQSNFSLLTVPAGKDPPQPLASENNLPGSTSNVTASTAIPTQEEMRNAYQSALQSRAPVAASVEEIVPRREAIRRLDPNEIAASRKRADALIASGDLAAARLVLRRAADDGDARAAMTLAETYDPAILNRLGVRGIVPDVVMARDWYEKARTFGATEATQRLEVLANKHR